jgi:beta-galactosidase
MTADGRDVTIVTIEIQDQKGRVVPDACQMLTMHLDGDAHILGAGNGDPSYNGEDHPKSQRCRAFSIPAFNGLAQFIIQSGHAPSTITLSCTSEKLKTGNLRIDTF